MMTTYWRLVALVVLVQVAAAAEIKERDEVQTAANWMIDAGGVKSLVTKPMHENSVKFACQFMDGCETADVAALVKGVREPDTQPTPASEKFMGLGEMEVQGLTGDHNELRDINSRRVVAQPNHGNSLPLLRYSDKMANTLGGFTPYTGGYYKRISDDDSALTDVWAMVNNKQFRNKILQVATQYTCAAVASADREEGMAFIGNLAHMFGDTMSKSHSKRTFTNEGGYSEGDYKNKAKVAALQCENKVEWVFTMDSVWWMKHGKFDKEDSKYYGCTVQGIQDMMEIIVPKLGQNRAAGDKAAEAIRNLFCNKLMQMDDDMLEAPCGGATAEFSNGERPSGSMLKKNQPMPVYPKGLTSKVVFRNFMSQLQSTMIARGDKAPASDYYRKFVWPGTDDDLCGAVGAVELKCDEEQWGKIPAGMYVPPQSAFSASPDIAEALTDKTQGRVDDALGNHLNHPDALIANDDSDLETKDLETKDNTKKLPRQQTAEK